MSSARNLYLELEDADNEELDTSSGCDMSFETSSENVGAVPMVLSSPQPPPPLTVHAPRKLFFNGIDDENDEVRKNGLFVY